MSPFSLLDGARALALELDEAQLAKLVGDFFHGFDRLVVGFHKFILRFCNCLTEVGRRSKQKEHLSDGSKKCSYSFVQALCVFI